MNTFTINIPSNISFSLEYFAGPKDYKAVFDGINAKGHGGGKDPQTAIAKAYDDFLKNYQEVTKSKYGLKPFPPCFNEGGYIMTAERTKTD